MKMNTKKNQIYLKAKTLKLFVVLFFAGAVSVLVFQAFVSLGLVHDTEIIKSDSSANSSVSVPDPFQNLSIEAHAAYVFDLSTNKVLYAKDENEKLPLASLTKLMTTLVALDSVSPDSVITISKEDLEMEGDSGLLSGERWRMGDLLRAMLIISSNDAAHAIARYVGSTVGADSAKVNPIANFITIMNEKAQTLGLSSMEFFNESGLDVGDGEIVNGAPFVPTQSGGYGSAKDVEALINDLWQKYPNVLEVTSRKDAKFTSESGIIHSVPNTDEALGHFSGIIVSKTGYTTLAGGNLAIIFDTGIGHPVAAVVLGSSYAGRFSDMQVLVAATLESINPYEKK